MSGRPFLVTTPIYYVNDVPHIGHAYTTVAADALARFQRLIGREVFFLTGTDEHGKKIEEAARERGKTPRELADEMVERFKELWQRLSISNDDFIRTTEDRHKQGVQRFWNEVQGSGEIELGEYEGLYCTGCEAYYTEKELNEGVCPVHQRPVERLKESSYFFAMSRHGGWLADTIRANEGFIRPTARCNEILSFVDEGLRDLSISRTTFDWGVPVPGDKKHVVYVWFDALLNYLTALGYPGGEAYKKHWGPDGEVVHLVGKDILRFHAVYWPTMLHAAGHRLPDQVFAHGWWTIEGRKMSKSLRNVVDPIRLIEAYGADEVRYFLLREVPFGDDGNFSHEALAGRIIGELANTVGNLANRVLPLVRKNFPEPGALAATTPEPMDRLGADLTGPTVAFGAYAREMERLSFSVAIEEALNLARAANDFIQRTEPWKLGKTGKMGELAWVFRHALRSLDTICVCLYPFLPNTMERLWGQLGRSGSLAELRIELAKGVDLPLPDQVGEPTPLFERRETIETARDSFLAELRTAELAAEEGEQQMAGPEITFEEFQRVELRVARIDAAYKVPKSKKLLRLEVDLGGESRQIVSGIAEHYEPDDLVGRRVVIVANLKPAKLMGVDSQGMLLAVESADGQLSIVNPGEGAKVGARVK